MKDVTICITFKKDETKTSLGHLADMKCFLEDKIDVIDMSYEKDWTFEKSKITFSGELREKLN